MHHYEEYMDAGGFQQAAENVASLVQQYRDMDGAQMQGHGQGGQELGPAAAAGGDALGQLDGRAPRRLRFL